MLNLKPPESSCACDAPVERSKRPRDDSDPWSVAWPSDTHRRLEVLGDNKVVINWMNGAWEVKGEEHAIPVRGVVDQFVRWFLGGTFRPRTDENDWCRQIFRESNKAADTHANWLMDNGDSGPGAQWMASDLHDKIQKSRHIVLSFDGARRGSGLGAAAWILWLRNEYGIFEKVSYGGCVLKNASAMIAEREALRKGIEHLTVLFPTVVSSFDFQVENSGRTVQYKLNAQSLRLFGLHSDVNDAHRAGANRLQNKTKRSDEVPDHGVKRVRWSPHEQDTKEFDPNEPSDASVQSRGLKRQPESTTEDLEDAGDQENRGDADDDDMKALGAVCEEPVITIGVDGETLDECENGEESYVDDVNGGFLDPEMVREARVEELAGYLKMQVYCRVPVAEIGSHKQIKTRWVDTNKGDERSPEVRCRLVAKEVKKRNNTEEESANFFASTPPLEAVKFLISEAMTKRVSRNNRPLKLCFIDVKKAHLCSDVLRELYVEPHPKQTNHRILSGGCNEPCTVRVTRRLRVNVSGQKRWIQLGSSFV